MLYLQYQVAPFKLSNFWCTFYSAISYKFVHELHGLGCKTKLYDRFRWSFVFQYDSLGKNKATGVQKGKSGQVHASSVFTLDIQSDTMVETDVKYWAFCGQKHAIRNQKVLWQVLATYFLLNSKILGMFSEEKTVKTWHLKDISA